VYVSELLFQCPCQHRNENLFAQLTEMFGSHMRAVCPASFCSSMR
jgi:hypothetical protein